MRTGAAMETTNGSNAKQLPGGRRAYLSAHAEKNGSVSTVTYSGRGSAEDYGTMQRERELLFAVEVMQ